MGQDVLLERPQVVVTAIMSDLKVSKKRLTKEQKDQLKRFEELYRSDTTESRRIRAAEATWHQ